MLSRLCCTCDLLLRDVTCLCLQISLTRLLAYCVRLFIIVRTSLLRAVSWSCHGERQQIIYARDNNEKRHLLVDVLLSQGVEGQRVLVFVATKREADMLEEFLYHERFPATSIHGDRTQSEREQALKSFRAGRGPEFS